MSNPLDGIFSPEPEAVSADPVAAPEVEQTAEATPAPSGPVRDESGRFAPKEAVQPEATAPEAQPVPAPEPVIAAPVAETPAPQPEPVVEPDIAAPATPPKGYVPHAALQAERRRVQALQAQLAKQTATPAPDPFEDFEGYVEHSQRAVEEARLAGVNEGVERFLALSQNMALADPAIGEEAVQKAMTWAETAHLTTPGLQEGFRSSDHPFKFLVEQHRRAEALERLSADPALVTKLLALANGELPAPTPSPAPAIMAAPAPQNAPFVAPPPSIASATSAAGARHVAQGPGEAFGGLFSKG